MKIFTMIIDFVLAILFWEKYRREHSVIAGAIAAGWSLLFFLGAVALGGKRKPGNSEDA